MAKRKNQHFVPKVYLNNWTTDGELLSYSPVEKKVRKQGTKTLCRSKHLYTMPENFASRHDQEKAETLRLLVETTFIGIWEERFPSVIINLLGNSLTEDNVRDLKSFVIVQSFRTPQFLKEHLSHIIDCGAETVESPYYFFSWSTQIYLEYIKNSTCTIYRSTGIENFITSDNPSTHWLLKDGVIYPMIKALFDPNLNNNPDYKILCPIHPKYFVMLSPNINLETSKEKQNFITFINSTPQHIREFNETTKMVAVKMLYAKEERDFLI